MTGARRCLASGLLPVLMAACSAAGPGAVPVDGTVRVTPFDNDRLPAMSPIVADPPFATADRALQSMTEVVTQDGGEPLAFGRIEVPAGWIATSMAALDGSPCAGRTPCNAYDEPGTQGCAAWVTCVLWQAMAPAGGARIAIGSPMRAPSQRPQTGGQGPVASRIAQQMLQALAQHGGTFDVVATSSPQTGRARASRRGWSTGTAWLAIARQGPLGATHEFLAIEVEAKATGREFHDVQTGPLLMIEVPAAQFDLAPAQAVWQSMQLDADWVPRWWLAWELRTVRASCEGGYQRGECTRRPGMGISYFQSGHSLGLWDLRVDHRYADAEPQRYDR